MPDNEYGMFIPTTNIWDPSQIYQTDVTSPEFKELLVRMYQNLNNMAMAINLKDTGYYDTSEFVTGQVFFPKPGLNSTSPTTPEFRQCYRKLINFGALPNNTTKTMAHGITIDLNTSFTRIYGASSNPTGLLYLPLPYASGTLVNNVELWVDDTNVNVTTGANWSAYSITYVILEYIKS